MCRSELHVTNASVEGTKISGPGSKKLGSCLEKTKDSCSKNESIPSRD